MTYARIEPAVLQIELHPYLTQEPLLKLTRAIGMAVTAYSSFGPQSYIEIGMGKGVPSLLEHDVVKKIAQANGKSTCLHVILCSGVTYCPATAQILLRWANQRNVAVIPKSNKLEHVISNLDCENFTISEKDMERLNSLNVNLRVRARQQISFPISYPVQLNEISEIEPRAAIFA